jgi:hypothetical protein
LSDYYESWWDLKHTPREESSVKSLKRKWYKRIAGACCTIFRVTMRLSINYSIFDAILMKFGRYSCNAIDKVACENEGGLKKIGRKIITFAKFRSFKD